ncbi:conserved hypothetical protein [Ricinus communis]|uniref:Uncharacterized protein n=1 Tax=Ricinus communis TaxID=3988 RepID=B9T6D2_RICCO|nr:conserved hypothetical protein [Ricinus communis]
MWAVSPHLRLTLEEVEASNIFLNTVSQGASNSAATSSSDDTFIETTTIGVVAAAVSAIFL